MKELPSSFSSPLAGGEGRDEEKGGERCREETEPDLQVEREEEWDGDAAQEPAQELEGWVGPERVQVLQGNAYARNVAPPFLTSAAYPAIR
jgi:hypothetical protein